MNEWIESLKNFLNIISLFITKKKRKKKRFFFFEIKAAVSSVISWRRKASLGVCNLAKGKEGMFSRR